MLRRAAAGLAGLFLGVSVPAQAEIVTFDYSGIVVGGPQDGDSYTASFTFDTSLIVPDYYPNSYENTPTWVEGYGPMALDATLTVAGTTTDFGPGIGGIELCVWPSCPGASMEYNEVYAEDGPFQQQLYAFNGGSPATNFAPQSFDFTVDSTYPLQSRGPLGSVDYVPLSVAVHVPEPATWILMILGLLFVPVLRLRPFAPAGKPCRAPGGSSEGRVLKNQDVLTRHMVAALTRGTPTRLS